jgi:hypothetical protein
LYSLLETIVIVADHFGFGQSSAADDVGQRERERDSTHALLLLLRSSHQQQESAMRMKSKMGCDLQEEPDDNDE